MQYHRHLPRCCGRLPAHHLTSSQYPHTHTPRSRLPPCYVYPHLALHRLSHNHPCSSPSTVSLTLLVVSASCQDHSQHPLSCSSSSQRSVRPDCLVTDLSSLPLGRSSLHAVAKHADASFAVTTDIRSVKIALLASPFESSQWTCHHTHRPRASRIVNGRLPPLPR